MMGANTKDRATTEPGGCECEHCGCIFIGGPEHSICGDCLAAEPAVCKGFEIEPGVFSGCDASAGDCPECGR